MALHRGEGAEGDLVEEGAAIRVPAEAHQLVLVEVEPHGAVPLHRPGVDRRSVDEDFQPRVLDLTDVDEVASAPTRGGRIGDADQGVLGLLVVVGRVHADPAIQEGSLEAQLELLPRLSLQIRVPVGPEGEVVDGVVHEHGLGGSEGPVGAEG